MTLLDWTDDKKEAYDRASKVACAQRRRGFPTPECLFRQVHHGMQSNSRSARSDQVPHPGILEYP